MFTVKLCHLMEIQIYRQSARLYVYEHASRLINHVAVQQVVVRLVHKHNINITYPNIMRVTTTKLTNIRVSFILAEA